MKKALTALYGACYGGSALDIYLFCHLVFTDGWDWQNPVASLPQAIPIFALTAGLLWLIRVSDELEIEYEEE